MENLQPQTNLRLFSGSFWVDNFRVRTTLRLGIENLRAQTILIIFSESFWIKHFSIPHGPAFEIGNLRAQTTLKIISGSCWIENFRVHMALRFQILNLRVKLQQALVPLLLEKKHFLLQCLAPLLRLLRRLLSLGGCYCRGLEGLFFVLYLLHQLTIVVL